jgi:hypothetical protein
MGPNRFDFHKESKPRSVLGKKQRFSEELLLWRFRDLFRTIPPRGSLRFGAEPNQIAKKASAKAETPFVGSSFAGKIPKSDKPDGQQVHR